MEFFTVKDVAEMLSVNEETVRRWIRDGKLSAEKGSGRKGSKISKDSLSGFLEKNKGFITTAASSTLGTLSSIGGAVAEKISEVGTPLINMATPVGSALLGVGLLKKLKDKKKDNKDIKIELMEEQYKLEQHKAQINNEISKLKSEADLIDSQIEKIKIIIQDI